MDQVRSAPLDVNLILSAAEPLVVRIVARRLRGWPSFHRDDVAQACRVKLWKVASRYDPSRGQLEPWISRIIVNVIRDELRKVAAQRGQTFHLLPDEIANDEQPAESDDTAEKLHLVKQAAKSMKPADAKLVRSLLRGAGAGKSKIRADRKSRVLKRLRAIIWSMSEIPFRKAS